MKIEEIENVVELLSKGIQAGTNGVACNVNSLVEDYKDSYGKLHINVNVLMITSVYKDENFNLKIYKVKHNNTYLVECVCKSLTGVPNEDGRLDVLAMSKQCKDDKSFIEFISSVFECVNVKHKWLEYKNFLALGLNPNETFYKQVKIHRFNKVVNKDTGQLDLEIIDENNKNYFLYNIPRELVLLVESKEIQILIIEHEPNGNIIFHLKQNAFWQ